MIDIIQIYNNYNIRYYTEGKNVNTGWVNIRCPFCDDHSNHLGFNIKEQYYKCWKCGHKWIDKVFEKLNIPKFEMNNHVKMQTEIIKKLNNKIPFKLPGNKLNNNHRNYLIKRNFDPDYIEEKYKIRGCDHLDLKYKFRIIIPVFYKNEIISFTSRDYTNKQELRYISCSKEMEIIEHKTILYNIDNCKKNYVFVVEGIFDCWRLGDNCCATFGTSVTKQQISLLLNFDSIFIIFDNEKEAQEQAKNLGEILSGIGKNAYVINISKKYKDIAEMSDIEAKELKKRILNNL